MKKKSKTATMKRRALKKGKADKRQNPSAKVAHRAIAKRKRKRAPRAVAPPPREVGVLDAIGEVVAICEELAQEMHDWSDNMPDSKQGSSKQDEVNAAAETLDEAVSDDPTDGSPGQAFLNEIKITIQDPTPKPRGRSRSTRLGDATSILTDAITAIEDYVGNKTGPSADTCGEVKDKLEEIESNLQGVEFPGMFG